MSIDLRQWVEESVLPLSCAEKFVLHYLAWKAAPEETHADAGFCAWPKEETVAQVTSQSVRSVQRCLSRLLELGLIRHEGWRGRHKVYYVDPDAIGRLAGQARRSDAKAQAAQEREARAALKREQERREGVEIPLYTDTDDNLSRQTRQLVVPEATSCRYPHDNLSSTSDNLSSTVNVDRQGRENLKTKGTDSEMDAPASQCVASDSQDGRLDGPFLEAGSGNDRREVNKGERDERNARRYHDGLAPRHYSHASAPVTTVPPTMRPPVAAALEREGCTLTNWLSRCSNFSVLPCQSRIPS